MNDQDQNATGPNPLATVALAAIAADARPLPENYAVLRPSGLPNHGRLRARRKQERQNRKAGRRR
jgi:hypothetical protein